MANGFQDIAPSSPQDLIVEIVKEGGRRGWSAEKIQAYIQQEMGSKQGANRTDAPASMNEINKNIEDNPLGTIGSQPKQERKGLFARILEKGKGRGAAIGEEFEQAKGASAVGQFGLGARAGTQVAGFVGDIFGEALVSVGRFISDVTPEAIKEEVSEAAVDALQTPLGRAGLKTIQEGVEAWEGFKEKNPEAAKNIEAVVRVASVIPLTRGAKVGKEVVEEVAEVAAKKVAPLAGKAAAVTERRLATQVAEDTLETVRIPGSKLSKKEAAQAAIERGGKVKGLLRRFEVNPSKIEIAASKAVEGIVKKGKDAFSNIRAIRDTIAKTSESIATGLEKNKAIFNNKQLSKVLNKAKEASEIVFGSDATVDRAYNSTIALFKKTLKEEGNTVGGLQRARKKFDSEIKKRFPNLFDKINTDNVRANAVKDVRRTINDFTEELLPEGNEFKETLRTMSKQFDAQDLIARNMSSDLGTTLITRGFKRLSGGAMQGVLVGGVSVGAIKTILANPVFLTPLLLGGAVTVGGKVIKSQALKKSLINILRGIEKAGKKSEALTAETEAMQDLIDRIA